MLKRLLIFSILISSISCSNNIEKPNPFLEREEMVNFLVDLSMAEGSRHYAKQLNHNNETNILTLDENYALVFEKYNLSTSQFDSINFYYTQHPKLYTDIYKEVLNILLKTQALELKISKEKNKLKLNDRKHPK